MMWIGFLEPPKLSEQPFETSLDIYNNEDVT